LIGSAYPFFFLFFFFFIQIGHLLAPIAKHSLIIVSVTVIFSIFDHIYHILAFKMSDIVSVNYYIMQCLDQTSSTLNRC